MPRRSVPRPGVCWTRAGWPASAEPERPPRPLSLGRFQLVRQIADHPDVSTTHPPLATIGDRVVAKVIDGIVLAVPVLIIHFVFLRGASRLTHLAVGFPLELLYTVVPVALFGQTLGKAVRRIRIVGPKGQRPGWTRSVRRYLIAAI